VFVEFRNSTNGIPRRSASVGRACGCFKILAVEHLEIETVSCLLGESLLVLVSMGVRTRGGAFGEPLGDANCPLVFAFSTTDLIQTFGGAGEPWYRRFRAVAKWCRRAVARGALTRCAQGLLKSRGL